MLELEEIVEVEGEVLEDETEKELVGEEVVLDVALVVDVILVLVVLTAAYAPTAMTIITTMTIPMVALLLSA